MKVTEYRFRTGFDFGGIMKDKILVLFLFFGSCPIYGNNAKPLDLRNPGAAVGYSVMSTTLPSVPLLLCAATGDIDGSMGSFLLSVSGIIVGPSVGHFYAGNTKRGLMSAGFRTVSGGAFILSSGALLGSVSGTRFGNEGTYTVIAIVSGLSTLSSIVFDIWDCPISVEKYNKSIRDYGGFYLAPEVDIKDESYGLSLTYRF